MRCNPRSATVGPRDLFVAKLTPDGTALVYATYLGGSDEEYQADIAVDAAGAAYVSALTFSTDFPTVNAFQTANSGNQDTVVAKLSADGSRLIYSTYLGGSGEEFSGAIAVDLAGAAYVAGGPCRLTSRGQCPPGAAQRSVRCVRGEACARRKRSAVFDLPRGHRRSSA